LPSSPAAEQTEEERTNEARLTEPKILVLSQFYTVSIFWNSSYRTN